MLVLVIGDRGDEELRAAAARRPLLDLGQGPGDGDPVLRIDRPLEAVVVAGPDQPHARDRQVPFMADIAVFVRRPVGILAGLADQGRRRDHRAIAGRLGIGIVPVERVVVAEGEREIADRRPSDRLARGIGGLPADAGAQFLGEQCHRRLLSRAPRRDRPRSSSPDAPGPRRPARSRRDRAGPASSCAGRRPRGSGAAPRSWCIRWS